MTLAILLNQYRGQIHEKDIFLEFLSDDNQQVSTVILILNNACINGRYRTTLPKVFSIPLGTIKYLYCDFKYYCTWKGKSSMYFHNPSMIHSMLLGLILHQRNLTKTNIVSNSAFNQFYNLTSVLYHKPRKTNFSIIALWGSYMK